MVLTDEILRQFHDEVARASQRPDVRDAVHNVHRALQDQIDLRHPICRTSGKCCRFEEFGHRLFVTTMEVATFLHDLWEAFPLADKAGGCPFQVHNFCSVHTIRPFGCRIFFCDETAADWQRRQYEFFHSELKRLHERLAVRYFYLDWLLVLRTVRSTWGGIGPVAESAFPLTGAGGA